MLRRAGGEERELTTSCGKRQTDNGISVDQDFRFQQYSTKVVCINTWPPISSSVNTYFVLFLWLAPFSPFETWPSSGDPVARQISKHRVEHFHSQVTTHQSRFQTRLAPVSQAVLGKNSILPVLSSIRRPLLMFRIQNVPVRMARL